MRGFWLNNDKVCLNIATSQRGGEGKGDAQTDPGTDRLMNLIGQTGKPTGIETTNPMKLGFSWRVIQSEF